MSLTNDSFSRRRFLRGLGGTALALPYLPSVMGQAQAASAPPKRFIFLFTANGALPDNWYPAPNRPQWKQLADRVREAPLTGLDPISTSIGADFNPFRSKLLLIRGLDAFQAMRGGHEMPFPLCGHITRGPEFGSYLDVPVTIDQLMAESRGVYPTPPAGPRSVHLNAAGTAASTSYTKTGTRVPAVRDVVAAWDLLFKNFSVTPPSPADMELLSKQQAARANVMNLVRGSYDRYRKNPRLGAEDRMRLDTHVHYLDNLNTRINQLRAPFVPTAGCQLTPRPASTLAYDEANIPTRTKLMIEILAAGIKCDRTRVATLVLEKFGEHRLFSFGSFGQTGIGDHHDLSHKSAGSSNLTIIGKLGQMDNWHGQQVAYLLKLLDVVEDPVSGSTYLDNSVVFWSNEDGVNKGNPHQSPGRQVLLAGSLGKTFRTGRYLDYRHILSTDAKGVETGVRRKGSSGSEITTVDFYGRGYNSLLIDLLQGMGVTPAEYEVPGTPGFGSYDMRALFPGQYSLADAQKGLPFIG